MTNKDLFHGYRLGVTLDNNKFGLITSELIYQGPDVKQTIWRTVIDTNEELGWTPPKGTPRPEEPLVVPENDKCQHDLSKDSPTLIVRHSNLKEGECIECGKSIPIFYGSASRTINEH